MKTAQSETMLAIRAFPYAGVALDEPDWTIVNQAPHHKNGRVRSGQNIRALPVNTRHLAYASKSRRLIREALIEKLLPLSAVSPTSQQRNLEKGRATIAD
jgi:hypothetical protein